MMDLRDKKVVVVGLARSGVGAANLLSKMGAVVTVTDRKPRGTLAGPLGRLAPEVMAVLGEHPIGLFTSADLIVVSPGVPLEIGPIKAAREKKVSVIGELELAYRVLAGTAPAPHGGSSGQDEKTSSALNAGNRFLAVTGSNGKSTTTTLLDMMVRESGYGTILGGNIGSALTEEILSSPGGADFVVAEVSSFQLEGISDFKPSVASILNITPDHMDRYHSLRDYAAAKARIFENQDAEDFLVINAGDEMTKQVVSEKLSAGKAGPRVFSFSRRGKVEGIYLNDGRVYCTIETKEKIPSPLIDAAGIRIKGVHNLENAMAASAMALLAGCHPGAVIKSLMEFQGLEHRLEFVRELDGVRYFNDSKGTNVGAVIKSLESFEEPLILIAGGRDKEGDFSALKQLVSEKVKALILIGEAAGKISAALSGSTAIMTAPDLKEALSEARAAAVAGDAVLLSPACASFDMFRDFEDRGMKFKQLVMELENGRR